MSTGGIPTQPASLPVPPTGDGSVTFGGGGHQTFRSDVPIPDGVISSAPIKAWKRVASVFDGKPKEQFCFLFSIPGREADGELAYYTGVKVSSHPKSKLVPFLTLIGARVPTPDNPTLPTDVVGRRANLFVVSEPSTSDPTKKYPKIKQVLAAS